MSSRLHDTTGPGVGTRADHAGDADPDRIIEAINRPTRYEPDETVRVEAPDGQVKEKTVSDSEWRWLPKMDLPGFGDEGETCGEDIPQFCEHCADHWTVGDTCGRSSCPRCAQTWVRNQATSAAAKLKACWAYRYSTESEHPFYQHMVVDIPDDWQLGGDPETVYWRTLNVIKEIMDELGIAGIPIYHPFRGNEETEDDRGEWANRLFSGNDWEEVSDELEFDPHFHIVGVAPFVDCTGIPKVHDETGFVIHRITQSDSNVSIGNDYDMAGVLAYCVSHAGVYEDSNGDMSAACHTRVAERPWSQSDPWLRGNAPTIQEDTRKQMDEIVRSVSPRVLGIEFSTVACVREVPSEKASDGHISQAAGSGDDYVGTGDGDGDGADQDEPEPDKGEVRLVKCQGRSRHISKAPEYLGDEDWRAEADHAVSLERKYEDWKRENGII